MTDASLTFTEITRLREIVAARKHLEQLPDAPPSIVFDGIELLLSMGFPGELTPEIQRVAGWALRLHQQAAAPVGTIDGCAGEIAFYLYAASRIESVDQVYFVQSVDGGPIKIGHSIAVSSRLRSLQSSSPTALRLLLQLPGGERLERFLHEAFAEVRLHGEWFSPHESLTRGIAQAARLIGVASR